MEKRAILAIVLSMMVILIWQLIFAPSPKKKSTLPQEAEKTVVEKEGGKERISERVIEQKGERGREVQDVVVETPLYQGVFTTAGGRLRSWTLKRYMDGVKTVVLWRRTEEKPPEPVEMVTVRDLGDLPLGTEIELNGEGINDLVFDVDRSRLFVERGQEGTIVFVGRSKEGLDVVKRYRFYGGEYTIGLDVEIVNRTESTVKSGLRVTWSGTVTGGGRYTFAGPSVLSGKVVKRLKGKAIRKGATFNEDIKWMASENNSASEGNYFVSLIAPERGEGVRAEVQEAGADRSKGIGFENSLIFPEKTLAAGEREQQRMLVYIGPKVPEILRSLHVEAEKAINFGRYLGAIERALLRILEFTHRATGNYGVDIIILSVLLKVIFWPLSRKSYQSMQEMQKIQPEMKMLQEKYKNDRERLNQEMMALYRRRKVNPVGGCLPMLVQFPFLIALYRALPLSLNLRHAPFVLWLRDLSAADTFFVDAVRLPLIGVTPVGPLPLLMGASMLIQQRMSPTTMGDPRQAKMMMFMPIMFIFIFLGFPSGLVLYWFVQNLMSIAEQYYNKRKGK